MVYQYTGPELARLTRYKSYLEGERDTFARRVKKDKIVALGSAAVLVTSTLFGWGLAAGLAGSGTEQFSTSFPDPRAIGLTLWAVSIPTSIVAGSIALPFWAYNATRVREKNNTIALVSKQIKNVEQGMF